MMVGKRTRGRDPMKRTTSMTEFFFDDLTIPENHQSPDSPAPADHHHHQIYNNQTVMAMVSPRPRRAVNRRNSADFALQYSSSSPITFLATCSLCNRRLPPGRDIYMYRGDSGFCSQECREEQMAEDERKEKMDRCKSLPKQSNHNNNNNNNNNHSRSRSSPADSHVSSSANAESIAAL